VLRPSIETTLPHRGQYSVAADMIYDPRLRRPQPCPCTTMRTRPFAQSGIGLWRRTYVRLGQLRLFLAVIGPVINKRLSPAIASVHAARTCHFAT